MLKLIRAYQINPSLKNAQKLHAYVQAHPMASCKLAKNEAAALADAIGHAYRWREDRFTEQAAYEAGAAYYSKQLNGSE